MSLIPKNRATDNPTDHTHDLIESVINHLRDKADTIASFNLWAVSDYYGSLLTSPDFENALRLALDNAGMEHLGAGRIGLHHSLPPSGESPVNVCQSKVFMTVGTPTTPIKQEVSGNTAATVSVIPGTGSIRHGQMQLDATVKTTYHIGRGETVRRSGMFRINDIIIDDADPDPVNATNNSRVSGAHADIIFADGNFFIRALPSGCRPEGGAATKLIHDSTAREITDSRRMIMLHDGDMIELGKAVILRFNIN